MDPFTYRFASTLEAVKFPGDEILIGETMVSQENSVGDKH